MVAPSRWAGLSTLHIKPASPFCLFLFLRTLMLRWVLGSEPVSGTEEALNNLVWVEWVSTTPGWVDFILCSLCRYSHEVGEDDSEQPRKLLIISQAVFPKTSPHKVQVPRGVNRQALFNTRVLLSDTLGKQSSAGFFSAGNLRLLECSGGFWSFKKTVSVYKLTRLCCMRFLSYDLK